MVEGNGLENRHTGNGIESSNLSLSVETRNPTRFELNEKDRCPSGLRSTTGTRVGVTASWVRIPPCPSPEIKTQISVCVLIFDFLVALSGESAVPSIRNPSLAEPNSFAPAHVCGAARSAER